MVVRSGAIWRIPRVQRMHRILQQVRRMIRKTVVQIWRLLIVVGTVDAVQVRDSFRFGRVPNPVISPTASYKWRHLVMADDIGWCSRFSRDGTLMPIDPVIIFDMSRWTWTSVRLLQQRVLPLMTAGCWWWSGFIKTARRRITKAVSGLVQRHLATTSQRRRLRQASLKRQRQSLRYHTSSLADLSSQRPSVDIITVRRENSAPRVTPVVVRVIARLLFDDVIVVVVIELCYGGERRRQFCVGRLVAFL